MSRAILETENPRTKERSTLLCLSFEAGPTVWTKDFFEVRMLFNKESLPARLLSDELSTPAFANKDGEELVKALRAAHAKDLKAVHRAAVQDGAYAPHDSPSGDPASAYFKDGKVSSGYTTLGPMPGPNERERPLTESEIKDLNARYAKELTP